MKKLPLYSELCYVCGLIMLSFSNACMARGDFGLSAVIVPSYLLHLKISQYFEWFTFGKAEYLVQGLLIIALFIIARRFKFSYLFSFCTALIYGALLDLMIYLVDFIPGEGFTWRLVFYIVGYIFNFVSVSLILKSYFRPCAYELFVKEIALFSGKKLGTVKIIFDYSCMLVSLILTFALFGFGHFEGIKWGTIITILINGWLISFVIAFLDKHFEVKDLLGLRKFIEEH